MLHPASPSRSAHTCRNSTSLACNLAGSAGGAAAVGAVREGRRGKAKSVASLEATLLRQYLSGTEKDLFRKHKSYFAHMDNNKAT